MFKPVSSNLVDNGQRARVPSGWSYILVILSIPAVALVSSSISMLGVYVSDRPSAERHRAAELVENLQALALAIPRLPNGDILRQGVLTTDWLDREGALPGGLQSSLVRLVRAQGQVAPTYSVQVDQWGHYPSVTAEGSTLQVQFTNFLQGQCTALLSASQSAQAVGYISTNGDPLASLNKVESKWTCRAQVGILSIALIDPEIEFQRFGSAISQFLNSGSGSDENQARPDTKETMMGSGLSPISVDVQRSTDNVTLRFGNLPFGLCTRVLLAGPRAFSFTQASIAGQTIVTPQAANTASALCLRSSGSLAMSKGPISG
ncbi:MAG TPA: hypothetical protein VHB49_06595 [Bradyrhizobium sp.]|nr:hypothetical protein [Bradyrhizobium sp.]